MADPCAVSKTIYGTSDRRGLRRRAFRGRHCCLRHRLAPVFGDSSPEHPFIFIPRVTTCSAVPPSGTVGPSKYTDQVALLAGALGARSSCCPVELDVSSTRPCAPDSEAPSAWRRKSGSSPGGWLV